MCCGALSRAHRLDDEQPAGLEGVRLLGGQASPEEEEEGRTRSTGRRRADTLYTQGRRSLAGIMLLVLGLLLGRLVARPTSSLDAPCAPAQKMYTTPAGSCPAMTCAPAMDCPAPANRSAPPPVELPTCPPPAVTVVDPLASLREPVRNVMRAAGIPRLAYMETGGTGLCNQRVLMIHTIAVFNEAMNGCGAHQTVSTPWCYSLQFPTGLWSRDVVMASASTLVWTRAARNASVYDVPYLAVKLAHEAHVVQLDIDWSTLNAEPAYFMQAGFMAQNLGLNSRTDFAQLHQHGGRVPSPLLNLGGTALAAMQPILRKQIRSLIETDMALRPSPTLTWLISFITDELRVLSNGRRSFFGLHLRCETDWSGGMAPMCEPAMLLASMRELLLSYGACLLGLNAAAGDPCLRQRPTVVYVASGEPKFLDYLRPLVTDNGVHLVQKEAVLSAVPELHQSAVREASRDLMIEQWAIVDLGVLAEAMVFVSTTFSGGLFISSFSAMVVNAFKHRAANTRIAALHTADEKRTLQHVVMCGPYADMDSAFLWDKTLERDWLPPTLADVSTRVFADPLVMPDAVRDALQPLRRARGMCRVLTVFACRSDAGGCAADSPLAQQARDSWPAYLDECSVAVVIRPLPPPGPAATNESWTPAVLTAISEPPPSARVDDAIAALIAAGPHRFVTAPEQTLYAPRPRAHADPTQARVDAIILHIGTNRSDIAAAAATTSRTAPLVRVGDLLPHLNEDSSLSVVCATGACLQELRGVAVDAARLLAEDDAVAASSAAASFVPLAAAGRVSSIQLVGVTHQTSLVVSISSWDRRPANEMAPTLRDLLHAAASVAAAATVTATGESSNSSSASAASFAAIAQQLQRNTPAHRLWTHILPELMRFRRHVSGSAARGACRLAVSGSFGGVGPLLQRALAAWSPCVIISLGSSMAPPTPDFTLTEDPFAPLETRTRALLADEDGERRFFTHVRCSTYRRWPRCRHSDEAKGNGADAELALATANLLLLDHSSELGALYAKVVVEPLSPADVPSAVLSLLQCLDNAVALVQEDGGTLIWQLSPVWQATAGVHAELVRVLACAVPAATAQRPDEAECAGVTADRLRGMIRICATSLVQVFPGHILLARRKQ